MALLNNRNRIHFGGDPRADLLPDAQRAELRHERTMPKLLLAIVASAVVAGLIWLAGSVPVAIENQRLQAAQAESDSLIQELASHSEVQQALSDSSALSALREQLSATEVQFMDVRDEVVAGMPEGATLLVFRGVMPDGVGFASDEVADLDLNPLCTTDGATIMLKVATDPLQPFAAVLDAATGLTGFKCVMGTKIESDPAGPARLVTVQIALGDEAYSGRFAKKEAGE